MPITLRKLAKELNVAPSTVSRALSGDAGVSEELTARIRRVADEMNYRPQPMRRRVNKVVGLVISTSAQQEFGDSYDYNLLAAALECVGADNWNLHSENVPREGGASRLAEKNLADGLLLCGHPSGMLCARIRELGIPAVVLNDLHTRTGLTSVIPHVETTTEEVVRRLREMGHRRIAMVATLEKYPTVVARVAGYRRAVEGTETGDDLLVHAGYATLQQGQIAVRQLMRRAAPPTALVFATDQLAIGGMIEAGRLGLRIPEDISIVGHDNLRLSAEPDPALTTVDLNTKLMVTDAFRTLRRMIEDPKHVPPQQLTVASRIVWRGSCAPCSAD